jgi:ABC-type lipoprotein release transport system permease subunit
LSIDVKMAWRNVWRNPRRSILTMLAIAFASTLLVFMLSWQFGSYDTMINATVKIHTGHLQVQAKDYLERKDIRRVVTDPDELLRLLRQTPGVAAYTLRANAFVLLSSHDRTYGAMVVGIQPEGEARVSTLPELVRKGSYLTSNDQGQAIIGRLLAKNLKVDIGDELVVLGQGRDGSIAATVIHVKGIFSSGQDEFDRGSAHMTLQTFQELFDMGHTVHEVVVLCDHLDSVDTVKGILASGIRKSGREEDQVVLDWSEIMPGLMEAIKMDLVSGFIFYIILILVVAFSILNTFLMAIFERTREFGVLMAMGTGPGRLTKILLIESASMALVGTGIGIIVGSLITYYFQQHGIEISGASEILAQYGLPDRMHPQLSWLSASIGAGIVLVITFLTALYPALKVRRLRPVEAMTYT